MEQIDNIDTTANLNIAHQSNDMFPPHAGNKVEKKKIKHQCVCEFDEPSASKKVIRTYFSITY